MKAGLRQQTNKQWILKYPGIRNRGTPHHGQTERTGRKQCCMGQSKEELLKGHSSCRKQPLPKMHQIREGTKRINIPKVLSFLPSISVTASHH